MRWLRRAGWMVALLLALPLLAAAAICILLPSSMQPRWRGYAVSFVYPLAPSVWLPQAAWVSAPERLFITGEISPLVLIRGRWLELRARLHNQPATLVIPLRLDINWRGAVQAQIPHAAPLQWSQFTTQGLQAHLSSQFLDHHVRWTLTVDDLRIPHYAQVRQARFDFGPGSMALRADEIKLSQPARAPLGVAALDARFNTFARTSASLGLQALIRLEGISSREFAATTVDLSATLAPLDAALFELNSLLQPRSAAALWDAALILGPTLSTQTSVLDGAQQVRGALALTLTPTAPLRPLQGTVDVDGDYALTLRTLAAALALSASSDAAQREAQGRAVDLLERAEKAAWLQRSGQNIALHMRWQNGVLAPQSVGRGDSQ